MFIFTDEAGNPIEEKIQNLAILPGSTHYFTMPIKTTSKKVDFSFYVKPRDPLFYTGANSPEYDYNTIINYSYDNSSGLYIHTGNSWEKITPENGISPDTAIPLLAGEIDAAMTFMARFRMTLPTLDKSDVFKFDGIKCLTFVFRGNADD